MAMHQLLPVEIATRDRVGTVKGGKNVIIDEDGTMSVDVADVGGDLAEIKKLLGMSGSGEAPNKAGTSAWSRVMYLLGLEIGEKSDAANSKGSLWASVKYLLGLNIGEEGNDPSDSGSLWARVKYLLDCCKDVQDRLDGLPSGPSTSDLTKLKERVTKLENRMTAVENRTTELEKRAGKTDTTLSDIINKFYGGGTINKDNGHITWPNSDKAAVGNMNVYGGDKNYIKTRDGSVSKGSDNDVKVV